ncbi:hypothetical protein [Tenacibaculum finnmarkense]|uniref:hypothetical protein n=1 Tax=Tenacibaculum finnmarkense TaxID=2781243 RepID=UPI001EFAA788|nr:hypothetical protein [Tenacibaculum finnmarkense]MCG8794822.1 hypothetical protein [Tenacibaculum finnmarkense]MCG8797150.1 hypothetical protein [Tenacibaculum finnmarkense]
MTVGDVYDIYKLTIKQSHILIWKYAEAFIRPVAEAASPFIVYAITEATLGAALPILSRIPIAMVTRGSKLENMISAILKLGTVDRQPHIRIFKTHLQPERIAKEMFNSLTKNRIGAYKTPIIANMDNGDYIIYRTFSASGFPATLEFNFSKLLINKRPAIIKFTK